MNKNDNDCLKELVKNKLNEKYDKFTKKILNRVDQELDLLIEKKYAKLILILADCADKAKRLGIKKSIYGAAICSLVNYILDISEINPIKFDLKFEDFLNPKSDSLPDIELLFDYERLNEILIYVQRKYSNEPMRFFKFQGLKTLSLISFCEKEIKKSYSNFCINDISLDDAKTIELLQIGETKDVFYFGDDEIRIKLKELKPSTFKELVNLEECPSSKSNVFCKVRLGVQCAYLKANFSQEFEKSCKRFSLG